MVFSLILQKVTVNMLCKRKDVAFLELLYMVIDISYPLANISAILG